MAMPMERLRRCRRGIVGIETAIVLIAFVIIASALAYVMVNTGFYASQKSKETIARGISEAASSLQLDGSVVAYVNKTGGTTSNVIVTFIILPVKVSVGKEGIDVSNKSMTVTIRISGTNSVYMPNIYNRTLSSSEFNAVNITQTLAAIYRIWKNRNKSSAYMAIVGDTDEILESNEKGFLIIYLTDSAAAKEYDKVKIEVKTHIGASLTVEREVPVGLKEKEFIDLG